MLGNRLQVWHCWHSWLSGAGTHTGSAGVAAASAASTVRDPALGPSDHSGVQGPCYTLTSTMFGLCRHSIGPGGTASSSNVWGIKLW